MCSISLGFWLCFGGVAVPDSVVLWRKSVWIFLTLSLATKDQLPFWASWLAPVTDLLSFQVTIR